MFKTNFSFISAISWHCNYNIPLFPICICTHSTFFYNGYLLVFCQCKIRFNKFSQ